MHPLARGLVRIPAGQVEVRDARTGTSRTVTLESFEISRTLVTAAEFAAVAGGDPGDRSFRPHHPVTWFEAVSWCNAASVADGLTPVYRRTDRVVTWAVEADGYRLPTEAEWEFACRAGTTGPTYAALAEIAWTEQDHVSGPQEVARKAANAFGLYDMIGNVWEWCWNHADTARYGDYRSLRGGGWADPAWSARASVRRGSAPDAVIEDVGLRVARGPVGSPGSSAAQGWSASEDARRADLIGPHPVGWTPLR